jgi:hypothetical protein
MNWLIREKLFTYFDNKFNPVNCMYFIKCCVNSSLHNSGCCIRSVAPWITVFYHDTQYSQRGWYITSLLLCDIPWNKAPRTDPRHIWRTVCRFFSREKNTDSRADGLVTSWASVCCGDICRGLLPLLLFFSFFLLKIVFHIASLRTWFLELVSAVTVPLSVSCSSFIYFFLAFPQYPKSSALFRPLRMTRHRCRNIIPVRYEHLLQWQQNRSIARMWLLYKIPPIWGYPGRY